jgi:hypothetical protein
VSRHPQIRRLLWVGPLTVAASVAAVLLVRVVAVTILDPPPAFTPLSLDSCLVLTAVFVTSAVLVFVLVARLASDPIRIYLTIAAVVLLFSFVPDVYLARSNEPGANWPDVLALMTLHVAAWAVCVTMLTKLSVAVDTRETRKDRR